MDDKLFLFVSSFIFEFLLRLSFSWRLVVVDLEFKSFEFRCFEQVSLFCVQVSYMLYFWFFENKCIFECEYCQRVILERFEDVFENVY